MTQADGLIGQSLQVSLTAKDLLKSVAWYVDLLGFTEERRYEREGQLRGVVLTAGDVRILVNQDDGARGWTRVKGEGFSLQINTRQRVDEVADRIRKGGGTLDTEPQDMPWGVRAFRVRDLDGYRWSISMPIAS